MLKKAAAVLLSVIMMMGLASCGASMPYEKYDLDEYVKVGEYKGLKAAPYKVSVTKDEIKAAIDSELQQAAETVELDSGKTVEEGDTVNIDYTGKIDGKKFDGGSAEGSDLQIGSGMFIEGFESGLIGKKTGDEVELDLRFPDDYSSEELKGKDVVFSVKINSVKRQQVPELDREYVTEHTDFKTVDEYRKHIKKKVYKEKEETEISNQKTALWSEVLDNSEVKKYPEEELDNYLTLNSEQMDKSAEESGMTRDEVLAGYGFASEKDFKAVNEDSSKLRIKQEMILTYIADKEGLEYTDEEKEELLGMYEQQGVDEEMIESQTGHDVDSYIHIELLYEKVLDFLLENAEITGAPEK